jgi:hypothetical protein
MVFNGRFIQLLLALLQLVLLVSPRLLALALQRLGRLPLQGPLVLVSTQPVLESAPSPQVLGMALVHLDPRMS